MPHLRTSTFSERALIKPRLFLLETCYLRLETVSSMPADYTLDLQNRIVMTKAWGTIVAEDAAAHAKRLTEDPAFQKDFSQVLDFSESTSFHLNQQELREFAAMSVFAAGARRAFVVPTSLSFGMTRMYATLRELAGGQEEFQFFDTREQALKWLLP